MIDPTKLDYGQMAVVAKNGSPMLLQAVGRVFGIGPKERAALGGDGWGIPAWTWISLAAGAGFVIGVRVYKAYPKMLPEIIQGE